MNRSIKSLVIGLAALALGVGSAPVSQASQRPEPDTSPVRVTHLSRVLPLPGVADLRVGEHANFDRVVIDLKRKVPGYHVRYVRRLTQDGSGQPVPLRGRRFIEVILSPARARNYEGPNLKQYQFAMLRGVAFMGEYEANVSFGLSLRARADFRVFALRDPKRIVIDVRH